jgi:hypothetical protein
MFLTTNGGNALEEGVDRGMMAGIEWCMMAKMSLA